VEGDTRGGLQILDAQRKLIVAMDHDDGERADRELGGLAGIVGNKSLRLRGLTIDQKVFGKPSAGGSSATHLLKAHDRDVRWRLSAI